MIQRFRDQLYEWQDPTNSSDNPRRVQHDRGKRQSSWQDHRQIDAYLRLAQCEEYHPFERIAYGSERKALYKEFGDTAMPNNWSLITRPHGVPVLPGGANSPYAITHVGRSAFQRETLMQVGEICLPNDWHLEPIMKVFMTNILYCGN